MVLPVSECIILFPIVLSLGPIYLFRFGLSPLSLSSPLFPGLAIHSCHTYVYYLSRPISNSAT